MYNVELYYGYEESESGIYHAFEAADSSNPAITDDMGRNLAEMLDISPDSENFNWDHMPIAIPDSVVAKIKADAINEYLGNNAGNTFPTPDAHSDVPMKVVGVFFEHRGYVQLRVPADATDSEIRKYAESARIKESDISWDESWTAEDVLLEEEDVGGSIIRTVSAAELRNTEE